MAGKTFYARTPTSSGPGTAVPVASAAGFYDLTPQADHDALASALQDHEDTGLGFNPVHDMYVGNVWEQGRVAGQGLVLTRNYVTSLPTAQPPANSVQMAPFPPGWWTRSSDATAWSQFWPPLDFHPEFELEMASPDTDVALSWVVPAAKTALLGSSGRYERWIDITNWDEAELRVGYLATVGSTGTRLYVEYWDGSAWGAPVTTGQLSVLIDSGANAPKAGGWKTLKAAVKTLNATQGGLRVRVVGDSGNGTTSSVFGTVVLAGRAA
jgi:hypothetical protein